MGNYEHDTSQLSRRPWWYGPEGFYPGEQSLSQFPEHVGWREKPSPAISQMQTQLGEGPGLLQGKGKGSGFGKSTWRKKGGKRVAVKKVGKRKKEGHLAGRVPLLPRVGSPSQPVSLDVRVHEQPSHERRPEGEFGRAAANFAVIGAETELGRRSSVGTAHRHETAVFRPPHHISRGAARRVEAALSWRVPEHRGPSHRASFPGPQSRGASGSARHILNVSMAPKAPGASGSTTLFCLRFRCSLGNESAHN